jgi:lipoprotein NlpD
MSAAPGRWKSAVRHFAATSLLLVLVTACSTPSSWHDNPQTHIVRKGETLFSIAWRYGKSANDLARWNRLGDGSLIYPGQRLRLTGPAASTRRSASTGSTTKSPPPRSLPSIPAEPPPTWAWPTSGRIDVNFGAKPGTGTGVLINGKSGQSIHAAASGRVVYAGSGLIGYGKLIILKHNDTYLSAYGYNASLLAKEGDQIKRGQKIATMGEGPERKPRLHFEIRRNGKPVNPRQYLPAR